MWLRTLQGEVEAAEAVTSERVGATLEDNCTRAVLLHDALNDGLENVLVAHVIDALTQWKVDRVVLASLLANVLEGER